MGTRAVIKYGDTMIATHWDGYPSSLGVDLSSMENITLENIIKVAESHSIDFATEDVRSMSQLRDTKL